MSAYGSRAGTDMLLHQAAANRGCKCRVLAACAAERLERNTVGDAPSAFGFARRIKQRVEITVTQDRGYPYTQGPRAPGGSAGDGVQKFARDEAAVIGGGSCTPIAGQNDVQILEGGHGVVGDVDGCHQHLLNGLPTRSN